MESCYNKQKFYVNFSSSICVLWTQIHIKIRTGQIKKWLMICKNNIHPIRKTTFFYITLAQKEKEVKNLFNLQMAHEEQIIKTCGDQR